MNKQVIAQIRMQINASIELKESLLLDSNLVIQLESLISSCLRSLRSGGKIIFAGNGGSFADAQHLSAEFTSKLQFDRSPLPSMALGTNNSAISAIANDYGYEKVFSRELEGIANSSDVFIVISTSGNSQNIIHAVDKATELGIYSVALTGKTGGQLAERCECLKIDSQDTARIQECHILLGHILCACVEAEYFLT
jgi:D-sedoheptulose 7-phosphate isomerase